MKEPAADPVLVGRIARAPILECSPDTPLSEAAARMHARHCGSIVVVAEGRVLGMWTRVDAIKLDFADPAIFRAPIAGFMNSPVKTISHDAPLREAAFRFRDEGVRHLLVLDAQHAPAGIVSQTDVINNQGIEFFVHLRDVKSAMHTDPLTVAAGTPAAEVVKLLRQTNQQAAVVDDGGRYGLFTATDVVSLVSDGAPEQPIGQLASYPLHSIPPEASLYQARSTFIERRIHHLGVMDGPVLVGLLTYPDIMACVEQVYLREMQRVLADQSDRLLHSQHALKLARTVAEASQQGIVITDAAGVVESLNPAFTAITGYTLEEVMGKNLRFLKSGRHDAEFFRAMFAALAERGTWSGELWNRRKNGELYAQMMTATLVRGQDGAIANYVAIFTDITRQKRDQEELLRTQQKLEEQESFYRIVLDTLPVNVLVKDEQQRFLLANDQAAAFLGMPGEAVRGRSDYDFFPAQTADRLRQADERALAEGKYRIDEMVVTLRGIEHHLLAHKRCVELGSRRLLIGASIDISSRRLAERRLADEKEILELIAGGAGQEEILAAVCRRIEQYLHGGLTAILLVDESGRRWRLGAAPNLPADGMSALDDSEIGSAAWLREAIVVEDVTTDARWTPFRRLIDEEKVRAYWSTPIFSAERQILGIFAVYHRSPRRPSELEFELIQQSVHLAAIAIERAQASAQLQRMATIDTITGLPNRQHFFSQARRDLARAQRNAAPLAACMIDVDHFKRINDTYGHAAGDTVLRRLAERLAASVRAGDICGRIGGEEFAVLLPDTGEETALLAAERLRQSVAATAFPLADDLAIEVSISAGVASFLPGDDLDRLLARADQGLYAAKTGGRNRVCRA